MPYLKLLTKNWPLVKTSQWYIKLVIQIKEFD